MAELHRIFGLGVKAHRHRLKLTQQQLADRVSMSLDTVAKLEGGTIGASFATVEKLARTLEVHPADLFRVDANDARFQPQLGELVAKLAALSEDDLVWIKAVIDAALRPRAR